MVVLLSAATIRSLVRSVPELFRARRVPASTLHRASTRRERKPARPGNLGGSIDRQRGQLATQRVPAEPSLRGRFLKVPQISPRSGTLGGARRQFVAIASRTRCGRGSVRPVLAQVLVAAYDFCKSECARRVSACSRRGIESDPFAATCTAR